MQIDPTIFKAYDIRGIVGRNVDETFAEHLGRAFGSEALAAGDKAGAITRFETLLVDYPTSALAPQARRELERMKGQVPPVTQ